VHALPGAHDVPSGVRASDPRGPEIGQRPGI
jgi:hypothetical protein